MVHDWLVVGFGGALGAVLRFIVAEQWSADEAPWATLTVNLTGSMALGALAAAVALSALSDQQALLFGTGLLGAFTTMSTFSMDAVRLIQESAWGTTTAYVLLTAIGGPLLAFLGWKSVHVAMA